MNRLGIALTAFIFATVSYPVLTHAEIKPQVLKEAEHTEDADSAAPSAQATSESEKLEGREKEKQEAAATSAPQESAEPAQQPAPETTKVETVDVEEVPVPATTAPAHTAPAAVPAIGTQHEDDGDDQEEIVKAETLDSLGLYLSGNEGSLGSSVWAGLNSTALQEAIEALPDDPSTPTTRNLMLRALLTGFDPAAMKPEAVPQPDGRILQARLKKLNEIGAFKEAFELYKKVPNASQDQEDLAMEGLTAMMGAGQLALGCLEEKALKDSIKQNQDFWPDLNLLCDQFLSGSAVAPDTMDTSDETRAALQRKSAAHTVVKERKLVAPQTLAHTDKTSILHLALLFGSGEYSLALYKPSEIAALKSRVIAVLLNWNTQRWEDELSVGAAAVGKGLITSTDLEKLYRKQLETLYAKGKPDIKTLNGWSKFLALYDDVLTINDQKTATARLKSLLALESEFGEAAYIPLARAVTDSKIAVNDLTKEEASQWLKLKLHARQSENPDLVAKLYPIEKKDDSAESPQSPPKTLILASYPPPEVATEEPEKEAPKGKKEAAKEPPGPLAKSRKQALSIVLKAFLDNPSAFSHNAPEIYEKDVDLTSEGDYVMPSEELRNNLAKSSDAELLGKVVLDSLMILGGENPDKLDPAVLGEVLEALSRVGLTQEALALAEEAKPGFLR